jgi:peptide subunit release factor RF-3
VGELQFEVIQYRLLHEYGLLFNSIIYLFTRPAGSQAAIPKSYWNLQGSNQQTLLKTKMGIWFTCAQVNGS